MLCACKCMEKCQCGNIYSAVFEGRCRDSCFGRQGSVLTPFSIVLCIFLSVSAFHKMQQGCKEPLERQRRNSITK